MDAREWTTEASALLERHQVLHTHDEDERGRPYLTIPTTEVGRVRLHPNAWTLHEPTGCTFTVLADAITHAAPSVPLGSLPVLADLYGATRVLDADECERYGVDSSGRYGRWVRDADGTIRNAAAVDA